MSKSKSYEPKNRSKQQLTQAEREAVEYGLSGVKVRKQKRQKNPRNFSYDEDDYENA